jgi:hypothetical protein
MEEPVPFTLGTLLMSQMLGMKTPAFTLLILENLLGDPFDVANVSLFTFGILGPV